MKTETNFTGCIKNGRSEHDTATQGDRLHKFHCRWKTIYNRNMLDDQGLNGTSF